MKADSISVMVLGVGGVVSQGILKALALSRLPCRVIGACVSPLSAGLYMTEPAYVSPPAAELEFLDWLLDVCRREHIDGILSGTEAVLNALAPQVDLIRKEVGAEVVVSGPDCLAIGDDKLRTCQWLEAQGFHVPCYAASEDVEGIDTLMAQCGFPLLAKPRVSRGGRGVFEIRDEAGLSYIRQQAGYVVQEYLGVPDEEYTAGCFCDGAGRVRGTIVMRRDLEAGSTVRAVVGAFPELRDEATRITAKLRPRGPCNVQMRLADGRPVCFELNVRFSSTTPMRARLGFNEVEAAVRHCVLGEAIPDLPTVTDGTAIRYWNEFYMAGPGTPESANAGRLNKRSAGAVIVEDYAMGGQAPG